MRTIGEHKLLSLLESEDLKEVRCDQVRCSPGHQVKTYIELAKKIAKLQFVNRDHVLLFRGQGSDHLEGSETSLKPPIFRNDKFGHLPDKDTLEERYARLERAEKCLVEVYARHNLPGLEDLERRRILRWSVLQHYEICPTPLLDVTHSLRIAASFASGRDARHAFVFVLGVPHLSGAVTASAEAELQIVRLASVCPPVAVRPHIQEGYLLGEYPELVNYAQKRNFEHREIDFGRRLVAKFWFEPKHFWRDAYFPKVSEDALYPELDDEEMLNLVAEVENMLASPANSNARPIVIRAGGRPKRRVKRKRVGRTTRSAAR